MKAKKSNKLKSQETCASQECDEAEAPQVAGRSFTAAKLIEIH